MSESLGILELLELRGFDRGASAKLVRHQDPRYPIQNLIREGWLEAYQAFQSKPVFHKCEYIVTFASAGGTRSRFLGVYQVGDYRPASEGELPDGCPHAEWLDTGGYFYEMSRVEGYEDLEGRIIVEWGKGTLAWHQKLRDKTVLEVLPFGSSIPVFHDYLEFTLSHTELVTITSDPIAHRDWEARLTAIAGVYLILASKTGELYIGSAHGSGGIWSRWVAYGNTGHGGNKLLRELLEQDDDYPSAFRYSLLQVLPKSLTRADVIGWEQLYKEKLGTRATGLNLN